MNLQLPKSVETVRQSFLSTLPKRAVCTKCHKRRVVAESFGVRLMNGKKVVKKNAAPKFLMQSQCKTCRGAKAKK